MAKMGCKQQKYANVGFIVQTNTAAYFIHMYFWRRNFYFSRYFQNAFAVLLGFGDVFLFDFQEKYFASLFSLFYSHLMELQMRANVKCDIGLNWNWSIYFKQRYKEHFPTFLTRNFDIYTNEVIIAIVFFAAVFASNCA